MVQITRIRSRGKDRFEVFFADGEGLVLSGVVLARFRLSAEKEISQQERVKIKAEVSFQQGYEQALNLLSYRPRSRGEIEDRLRQKQLDPMQTNSILIKLENEGLLNDEAFVRWWVEQRVKFRPRSRRKLVAELAQKRIGLGIAQKVVSELVDDDQMAVRLLAKKTTQPDLLSAGEKQKIRAWLSRQGFSWETIRRLFKN